MGLTRAPPRRRAAALRAVRLPGTIELPWARRRRLRAVRLPGTIELPWARRRRLRAERGTVALGVAAGALTATAIAVEVLRLLRERIHEHPELEPLEGADIALRETVAAAVAGLESMSERETVLLNLLASFSVTFAAARAGTYAIRRGGRGLPLRDLVVGERHIHHFVPGIGLAFLAGGAALLARDRRSAAALAVPFGAGVALTLDESALLLSLDDVYWSEEGIVSVQITLAALALLSALTLARRALRRGERHLRLAAQPPARAAETGPPRAADAPPDERGAGG